MRLDRLLRRGCHRHPRSCQRSPSRCNAAVVVVFFFVLCSLLALLVATPARCAVHRSADEDIPAASTSVNVTHFPLHDEALTPYDDDRGACPALTFEAFVAAALGFASSTRALTTCSTAQYSTIFDDIYLARRARDATDSLATSLWRLTHGNTNPLALYDNAADFLSLRAEMGAWVRANRTVGMSPSAYEAVVRGAAAVLGHNGSLLHDPVVEVPADALESRDGDVVRSRGADGVSGVGAATAPPVNWTARIQQCRRRSRCIQQVAQQAYRQHANASLRSSPALLVSNATFARAQRYYEHAVFSSTIVRSFQLDPGTTAADFDRNLRDLLRSVQQLWDEVVSEAATEAATPAPAAAVEAFEGQADPLRFENDVDDNDSRDNASSQRKPSSSSIPAPYLPFVRETDFTGPRLPETRRLTRFDPDYPSPSRHSGMRLQALRRILPTAILYQSSPDCTSCDVFDRAFDVLPAVYKRMCSRGYRSIVSCSPVTLFLRTSHVRPFQLVPSLELYARLAHSRRAVLRVADLKFRHEQRGQAGEGARRAAEDEENKKSEMGRGEEEEEEDWGVDDATQSELDASAQTAKERSGAKGEEEEKESEWHDDGDGDEDEDDEDTRGSLFYSLQVKYGKFSAGIEDEVRPRTQFQPIRIPLRLQPSVATVEEAVVGIISDLVGSGAIQFLFLDPTEVSQIARENERVKKMLQAQQREKEQQDRQQLNNASSSGNESDTTTDSATAKQPSSSSKQEEQQQPPQTNPEDHPKFRKVVSFNDLATKLVAAHTRALFGDVSLVHANPTYRVGGGGHLSGGSAEASHLPWWASSWPFRFPRALWGLLSSGLERPLYLTVFVLLVLYQRWWNRWQRVSYW